MKYSTSIKSIWNDEICYISDIDKESMNIINNEMKISMILNYLYFWTSYFDNKEIMDDDENLYNNYSKYLLCN